MKLTLQDLEHLRELALKTEKGVWPIGDVRKLAFEDVNGLKEKLILMGAKTFQKNYIMYVEFPAGDLQEPGPMDTYYRVDTKVEGQTRFPWIEASDDVQEISYSCFNLYRAEQHARRTAVLSMASWTSGEVTVTKYVDGERSAFLMGLHWTGPDTLHIDSKPRLAGAEKEENRH